MNVRAVKPLNKNGNKSLLRPYLKGVRLIIPTSYSICILMLIIITGCKGPDTLIQQDTFQVILGSDGGRTIALRGNSSGYHPGGDYDFIITIQNHGSENWDDKYCLLLINEEGVQALLGEATFNLSSDDSYEDTITTSFPLQVTESAYGVSLIVSSGDAITGIIWVGDSKESQIHLSKNPTECSVGPLGMSEFSINRK